MRLPTVRRRMLFTERSQSKEDARAWVDARVCIEKAVDNRAHLTIMVPLPMSEPVKALSLQARDLNPRMRAIVRSAVSFILGKFGNEAGHGNPSHHV